ncbi:TIGR00730 family Rossman fold protein [Euzebya tangerina]|uniref:LOG family protein n=1 Tax=Euzebya tangerina TaxID=591198 RepID=UPI000E30DD23|nr:TIGR00730 family Rossman fold protein [Euzebya tangerina]
MSAADPTSERPTRIAVFCGSQPGTNPAYSRVAEALGAHLAAADIDLVYGGGSVGLMGVLADAVLAGGGRVTGVIPRWLADRELAHHALTELVVVEDMHQRKAKMAELADAFVALPGGIGTLEELFEQWTWGKLALHTKPVMILDVDGFFASFVRLMEDMVTGGFLSDRHAEMLSVLTDPAEVTTVLSDYHHPPGQWHGEHGVEA